jgi:hypothetical protein
MRAITRRGELLLELLRPLQQGLRSSNDADENAVGESVRARQGGIGLGTGYGGIAADCGRSSAADGEVAKDCSSTSSILGKPIDPAGKMAFAKNLEPVRMRAHLPKGCRLAAKGGTRPRYVAGHLIRWKYAIDSRQRRVAAGRGAW